MEDIRQDIIIFKWTKTETSVMVGYFMFAPLSVNVSNNNINSIILLQVLQCEVSVRLLMMILITETNIYTILYNNILIKFVWKDLTFICKISPTSVWQIIYILYPLLVNNIYFLQFQICNQESWTILLHVKKSKSVLSNFVFCERDKCYLIQISNMFFRTHFYHLML